MDIIPNVVILTSQRRDRDAGVYATFIRIIIRRLNLRKNTFLINVF